jgi:hypothetical protein
MFGNFKPERDPEFKVPFFDDVSQADGWEGHTTSKSIDTLVSEISANMSRLNCIVTGVVPGTFGDRYGFQIHFAIRTGNGQLSPSRMDIACLPLRQRTRYRSGPDPRIEQTKKMALFMLNKAVKGLFFMSALIPGYIPFMSLMLESKTGSTLGQMWVEHGNFKALQAPPQSDFEEVIDAD